MIPLIAPLGLVETYSENFKSHFNADTYESFKRYLSGLLINENKTIDGINRMFVLDIQHQSHLTGLRAEAVAVAAQYPADQGPFRIIEVLNLFLTSPEYAVQR